MEAICSWVNCPVMVKEPAGACVFFGLLEGCVGGELSLVLGPAKAFREPVKTGFCAGLPIGTFKEASRSVGPPVLWFAFLADIRGP
jgi:hypothetical protein